MNFFCTCSSKIISDELLSHMFLNAICRHVDKQRQRRHQVSVETNMGNQICRYCTSPQPEWSGNTALIHEQNAFTEEEKQRRLEEETQKQSERALVYEDILRKISDEKEVNIAKAAVVEDRRKKEMEFDRKIQEEKDRLLAQDEFLSYTNEISEEEKDELNHIVTPLKVTKEISAIGSAITNSIPGLITSPIEKSVPSLIPFPIEKSPPTLIARPITNLISNSVPNSIASPGANSDPTASPIANSVPSLTASPISNFVPSLIASPIANFAPSFVTSPIANSAPSLTGSPMTIVSPTLARTDLEIERDVEKESVSTDRDDESIPAFLFDIIFNQSSSQSAGMKILPHKLSYKTAAGEFKSNLLFSI